MLANIENKWEIISALKLYEDNPRLLGLVKDETRNSLNKGDWVKIKFNQHQDVSIISAYLWVKIVSKENGLYKGKIRFAKSLSVFLSDLNKTIQFSAEHILQVIKQKEIS